MDNNIVKDEQYKYEHFEEKDNDMFFSLRSLMFFITFYLPYMIMVIINIGDDYDGSGFGFLLFLGGLFILIPTIISFVFAIIAMKKYYKLKENKIGLRKFLNVLNIMTIVAILPYLFFCLYFVGLLFYVFFRG